MGAADQTEGRSEAAGLGDQLAFLAFSLSHAACGDGPLEMRVGERCLIGWCPHCARLGVFCAPPE